MLPFHSFFPLSRWKDHQFWGSLWGIWSNLLLFALSCWVSQKVLLTLRAGMHKGSQGLDSVLKLCKSLITVMPELQLHFTILFPGLMEFPLFHCLHRTQNGALKSVSSRISTLANTVWITSNFDKHPVPFHIQESLHSTASSVVSFTPHIWSPPQSLFIMLSLRTVSLSAASSGIFLEMSALISVLSFPIYNNTLLGSSFL